MSHQCDQCLCELLSLMPELALSAPLLLFGNLSINQWSEINGGCYLITVVIAGFDDYHSVLCSASRRTEVLSGHGESVLTDFWKKISYREAGTLQWCLRLQDWRSSLCGSVSHQCFFSSGVDWGGVRREWFSLLCGQLFDSKFGLFVSFHDSPTGLVHPNPDRPPHLKVRKLNKKYHFRYI